MAKSILLKKFCCLSLSKACILFGLLDIALNIFILVTSSISYHEYSQSADIFFIIISSMALCTCLLMIIGSIKNNRWLMVPHIILNVLMITTFIVGSIINIILLLLATGKIVEVLWTLFLSICSLVISTLYCIVMVSRGKEIKEGHTILETNEIEIERC